MGRTLGLLGLYSPRKPKKTKFRDLGPQMAWRSTSFGFFGFLGQYSNFALFALTTLVFLGQYSAVEAWGCKNAVLSQRNESFKPIHMILYRSPIGS